MLIIVTQGLSRFTVEDLLLFWHTSLVYDKNLKLCTLVEAGTNFVNDYVVGEIDSYVSWQKKSTHRFWDNR